MRKIINVFAFTLAIAYAGHAQSLKTPAPSSTTNIKQDFGLSSIELSYSRPNMKGRKIFGDLTPYGKVWRTGANQATTLTFGDEVTIGSTKIPAGKYGLVSIPGATSWTLIITKQTDITSPAAYKQENDVVRVKAKPTALTAPVETFTMQFVNVKAASCGLQIIWDKTAVVLPITTDVDTKVMAQISETVNSGDEAKRPYAAAAQYYLENGKDLNQAMEWFNKAEAQNPKAFWVLHQKANCLAKLGKKQDAIATANKSIALAKEAKNDDYVALNQKLIAKLKG
jgi:tetratricopeptide (TPR) repeat protein